MEEGKVREILGNRISAQDTKVVAALSALIEERSKQRVIVELEAIKYVLRPNSRAKGNGLPYNDGYYDGMGDMSRTVEEDINARLARLKEAAS